MTTAQSNSKTRTTVEEQTDLDRVIDRTQQSQSRQSLVGGAATILGVPPEKLCDLLRNVWRTSKDQPPLTDQEMFCGISMIARYELDPVAREVYVTRGKGGIFTIVSIDGWIKILDRTDGYDGFDVEFHHDQAGEIDWIETTIYSKKRSHPTKYRAFAEEYAKLGGTVAKLIPTHMLRIFSLRHAARLFTPLGGMVLTEEEAAWIAKEEPAQRPVVPRKLSELTPQLATDPANAVPVEYGSIQDDDDMRSSYECEIENCDTIAGLTAIYDRWFGPDCPIEYTPEQNTAGLQLLERRTAELRQARENKS